MKDWKTVFTSEIEHRALIVKDLLEKSEIAAVILNKRDSSYHNFGNFEVSVNPDHVIKALKIIADEIAFE
jgi:hypothetical protein